MIAALGDRCLRGADRLRRDPRMRSWKQFVGYAVCGGLATGVDALVFYALAWRVIPALGVDDPLVRLLGLSGPFAAEAVRSRNFVIVRGLAFLASNLTAYLLNIRWVFTPGRHGRTLEIALFYAVSVTSVGLGTLAAWMLIRFFGWSSTASYLCNVVSAVLINFAARKYWIFKG